KAGPRTIGPGRAPAGDSGEDQARVVGGQDLPAKPPLLEETPQELLDEDVGAAAQPAQERLAPRMGEVQGDRALAARVHLPPELAPIAKPRTQGIAAARGLDLDDGGAVIGEDRREHAAGDKPRAVDDPKPGERSAHWPGVFLKCCASASIMRARASLSVRPVVSTPQATATATHSPSSFRWTSTSNCMSDTLPQKRDPSGRGAGRDGPRRRRRSCGRCRRAPRRRPPRAPQS